MITDKVIGVLYVYWSGDWHVSCLIFRYREMRHCIKAAVSVSIGPICWLTTSVLLSGWSSVGALNQLTTINIQHGKVTYMKLLEVWFVLIWSVICVKTTHGFAVSEIDMKSEEFKPLFSSTGPKKRNTFLKFQIQINVASAGFQSHCREFLMSSSTTHVSYRGQ